MHRVGALSFCGAVHSWLRAGYLSGSADAAGRFTRTSCHVLARRDSRHLQYKMTGKMQRRDVLKLGASLAALPAAQSQTPLAAPPANWTPSFFNAHQNDTVIDFVDIVIPATDTPAQRTRWSIATSTSFSPRRAIRRKMNWVRLLWNDGQPATESCV